MKIWVDADACPVVIKEILYRAAGRWQVHVIFVANQMLRTQPSPWIRAVQVPGGFDVADQYIVDRTECNDLVITADIPLAALVLQRGGQVLSPRGERFDNDTIAQRLQLRDMLEQLRDSGVQTGGPPAFSQTDRRDFANALDRLMMARQLKSKSTSV